MIQENFGNKIKEIRNGQFLSQTDLAFKSGIERSQISKIEQGKANVTLETIEKLALALNVKIREIMDIDASYNVSPFVKWAGGKTQIIKHLKENMPKEFGTYFEPFVGGGALLFAISPQKAIVNDNNYELIAAYRCFQNEKSFKKLKEILIKHEEEHNEEYYLKVRSIDRDEDFSNLSFEKRAARMIYLNKSCFNGLYRVNSKGYFNVPSAKKNKVITFDRANFESLRNYFSNNEVKFYDGDYEKSLIGAKEGDFIYFDPPYDTFEDKVGFVDYGKEGFGKKDQIRLADCVRRLSDKGVKIMLSNHNTKFINELYQGFNIKVIQAKRMINSKSDGRGYVEEVIITNY